MLQGERAMPASPTACRRLFLVRHGHYDRVDELGDLVWGLSPLGRRQAVRTGRRLAQFIEPGAARLQGLYSSPWPRALQTAEIIARELAVSRVRIKPYLHEAVALMDPLVIEPDSLPDGAQLTDDDDRARVETQVDRVRGRFFRPPRRDETLVLVAHGNLIRYLLATTLGLPLDAWLDLDIAHASVTELRVFSDGHQGVGSYNETGHLPPALITSY
jgi:broad specificity phosphatase PhoE